jgi:hypothetical protein
MRKELTPDERLRIDYRIETGHVWKIGGKMTKEYKVWLLKRKYQERKNSQQ